MKRKPVADVLCKHIESPAFGVSSSWPNANLITKGHRSSSTRQLDGACEWNFNINLFHWPIYSIIDDFLWFVFVVLLFGWSFFLSLRSNVYILVVILRQFCCTRWTESCWWKTKCKIAKHKPNIVNCIVPCRFQVNSNKANSFDSNETINRYRLIVKLRSWSRET